MAGAILFPGPVICVRPKRAAGLALGKTFLAIYRTVPAGLKRNFAFLAAISADRFMQNSLAVTVVLSCLSLAPGMVEALERCWTVLSSKRLFKRPADQGIYLLFQTIKLLLHLNNESLYIRWMFFHISPYFLINDGFAGSVHGIMKRSLQNKIIPYFTHFIFYSQISL